MKCFLEIDKQFLLDGIENINEEYLTLEGKIKKHSFHQRVKVY